ncbi:alpha/beta hydrolase family protein [Alkaliphilus peptidifermentans]|uniref:Pimeloyl-ACP methyl ester carboxylesterase n=1 Tax=Alkaliphilus peptidifermentans DSM 18978 TaxID=1120976 RepID=A0A1G5IN71_9FIRM|nr:alpha/beta hydrolase [Alkaliphilus peptidifermentans]SCY77190.1 Pimeloyl-ACP methyl ester carboxylesterase [Alkaliphilus peptidifermentans DSM 18978]
MKIFEKWVGQKENIYLKCLVHDKNAPNVIFLMTPIGSIENEIAVKNYRPLFDKGFNVFAIDLPSIGNSVDDKFSYDKIKMAINDTIEYILENFSDSIHLYGGTGTGGIVAQAIASDKDFPCFKTFSQFGVANHNDLSVIGNSAVLKFLYPLVKMTATFFPKRRIKFKVPKYNGFNAEKENIWYQNMMKKHPGIFDLPLDVVYTLLWLLISKDSPIKAVPQIPTLVMAAKHDRYFTYEYVIKYYEKLGSNKRLHWIDDSHCVFAWGAQQLADEVNSWIHSRNVSI